MSSRDNWGQPAWDQHYNMPPHYDGYQGHQDNFYDHPPTPRPTWQDGRHQNPSPVNRPPPRGRGGRGRGRGRGDYSAGRGQTYNRSNSFDGQCNGPKTAASRFNSSNNKPAWLSQSTNKDASSETKPTWLTQSVQTKTSIDNSTDSKPAWLTQTNTAAASGNMPSWLTASPAEPNSTSTSYLNTMPAWLQPSSSTMTDTMRSQSPPPPPPPSCPPPRNQPKIRPVGAPPSSAQRFQTYMSQTQMAKQANRAKNKEVTEVKVAAPGEANFISFKNSLQEYSQKKGFPVPVYRTFKNGYGQSASVEANKTTFQSSGIQKDKKEAEQNAAYEALKALSLLSPTVPFISIAKAGTKRPQPSPQAVAKKLKGEIPLPSNSPNYKCQLNEFCQKFHLPVPTYETVHETGGFVTTLIYNKKVYLSTSPQPTKKAAEQNVAQFVLSKVNQAPPPLDQNQKLILQNFVAASTIKPEPSTSDNVTTPEPPKPEAIPVSSVQDLAAKNATPMISYKNKLQEVCQKQKSTLPIYDTLKEGNMFQCKVAIDDKIFNATGCKTKKGAEQSAARVALQTLGLLDE